MGDTSTTPDLDDIIAYLLTKESKEALEDRLADSIKECFSLEDQFETLDFGKIPTPEEFHDIFTKTVNDTKNFLDVDSPPISYQYYQPKHAVRQGVKSGLIMGSLFFLYSTNVALSTMVGGFFGIHSGYLHMKRRKNLNAYSPPGFVFAPMKEATIPGIVAHEYTHYLQHNKTDLIQIPGLGKRLLMILGIIPPHQPEPLTEGHARLVQLEIAKEWVERHDNPAFVHDHVKIFTRELQDAYAKVYAPYVPVKESLLEHFSSSIMGRSNHYRPHPAYALGTATMAIAEAREGPKVIHDVLKNDFSFFERKGSTLSEEHHIYKRIIITP